MFEIYIVGSGKCLKITWFWSVGPPGPHGDHTYFLTNFESLPLTMIPSKFGYNPTMCFQEEKGLRKNQLKTKNQTLICRPIVLVQSKVIACTCFKYFIGWDQYGQFSLVSTTAVTSRHQTSGYY